MVFHIYCEFGWFSIFVLIDVFQTRYAIISECFIYGFPTDLVAWRSFRAFSVESIMFCHLASYWFNTVPLQTTWIHPFLHQYAQADRRRSAVFRNDSRWAHLPTSYFCPCCRFPPLLFTPYHCSCCHWLLIRCLCSNRFFVLSHFSMLVFSCLFVYFCMYALLWHPNIEVTEYMSSLCWKNVLFGYKHDNTFLYGTFDVCCMIGYLIYLQFLRYIMLGCDFSAGYCNNI